MTIQNYAKHAAKNLLPYTMRRKLREAIVSVDVRHLHGPKVIKLTDDEAVVTCLVKNGQYYIRSFIEHYIRLGFRHIFLLDNGSNDNTINIAIQYKNVSVCQSKLAVEAHQGLFKKHLARSCVRGGWCLDVDIDEFFDFPLSDRVSLPDFLRYLNRDGYTAVIAQMLDMFSDQSLASLAQREEQDVTKTYQHYDISAIEKTAYRESDFAMLNGSHNSIADKRTEIYRGGIRKALYGHECLLTKHSLFRPDKVSSLFEQVHFVNGARLADLSCVLFHYKLTVNAIEIAEQNRVNFPGNEKLYADTIAFVKNTATSKLKLKAALRLECVNDLLDIGFLFASDRYLAYCREIAEPFFKSLTAPALNGV